ncbi:MAG: tetratricopeptide repeat protein [Bdellovibrionales bacterium]|nr:tetratricopeptide repeat protein [Bdellovibrionales bacterium]
MKKQNLILGLMVLCLSGCLVTRQAVRDTVKSEPLSPEQQRRANAEVRLQETDEQLRMMYGRIESVENRVNILAADKTGSSIEELNARKDLNDKLKIYEEAITKLESQYLALAQKVEGLALAGSSSSRSDKPSANKSSYQIAEEDFSRKKWKEAIVSFEKYRSMNPTGRHYHEATYKIGYAFHELGMKTEAKAFYAEVVEKFPRSDWAKKARARMKALK